MDRSLYSFLILLLFSARADFSGNLWTSWKTAPENLDYTFTGKLATANNDLALNIYHRLANESSENIFFSPLSLSTVFGMLYYGSRGYTAKELWTTLGYERADLPGALVHRTFQKYLTESLPSQDPSAYVLNSANAILADKHLDLIPYYKKNVQDFYQAIVQDVDFLTQAPQIVEEINDWVKEKTNGKIDQLLDQLYPDTLLVLLNAVYFKGTWKTKFDSINTYPETFYNNGLLSEAKKVPMMRLFEYFPQAYDSDVRADAIEIPYKGDNISMLILLPYDRDGLESLEKRLTLQKLSNIRHSLQKIPVFLIIPKFKVQYSKDMSEVFQSLGAKSTFSPGADFSGMTSNANVFVNQVLHKAVVEVNEEGSEASAATAVIVGRKRYSYVADHPFLFAIIDNRNDMILFLGRVTNL